MEPRSYTFTFSDNERKFLIFAMGALLPGLRTETMPLLMPTEFLALHSRLVDAKPDSRAAAEQSGHEAAKAMLTPPAAPPQPPLPELRDRWARGKDGEARPFPANAESVTFTIDKVTPVEKPANGGNPYMRVAWEKPPSMGRGFLEAKCWDPELWPFLANRVKQTTLVYITRKGTYINIVGLRA